MILNILTIARRELSAFFSTPVGWIVMSAFLFINGVFFVLFLSFYTLQSTQSPMSPYGPPQLDLNEHFIAPFYGNVAVLLLFVSPVITMRLIAEDRKTRVLDLLLTSPITTTEIVLGKFLGALGFIIAMLLSTLHFPLALAWVGSPDLGVVASCFLSVVLVGASVSSVGLLVSSFTESQIIAGIVSFVVMIFVYVLSMMGSVTSGTYREVIEGVSLLSHMEPLTRGLMHSKDIVYFVSFITFFLFATHQRVEAFRWS